MAKMKMKMKAIDVLIAKIHANQIDFERSQMTMNIYIYLSIYAIHNACRIA